MSDSKQNSTAPSITECTGDEAYRQERMAGSAVAAFASALLILQLLKWSNGSFDLLCACRVNIPHWMFHAVAAVLITLSVIVSVFAIVRSCQTRTFRPACSWSVCLAIMALFGSYFGWILAWITLLPDLPWRIVVFAVGHWLFFFVGFWILRGDTSCPRQPKPSLGQRLMNGSRLVCRRLRLGHGCDSATDGKDRQGEGRERTGVWG